MCRSKSPLDLVNKLNEQILSNLACGVLFSPVLVNIEGSSLLSLEDKQERKEQETERSPNPWKIRQPHTPSLCIVRMNTLFPFPLSS